ncbi:YetF domain-containing protein [Virgibacillus proomii]|uniref:YetF domain-containing protein n=1 Tax=Virgibacillus proomii TaxID=84407 RepID=UPI00359FA577
MLLEGKVQLHNLNLIQKDEQWLRRELKATGYFRLEDVFYATVRDTDHSLKVDNG